MPGIRVFVTGDKLLKRKMRKIDPKTNPEFVRRALVKGGFLIQRDAQLNQIARGGKGPPLRDRLTSRTGTGRRSIRVDRKGLREFFIDIGSDLRYMQLHETGGKTMPARPYLAPALDAVDKDLERLFSREWGKEVSR